MNKTRRKEGKDTARGERPGLEDDGERVRRIVCERAVRKVYR